MIARKDEKLFKNLKNWQKSQENLTWSDECKLSCSSKFRWRLTRWENFQWKSRKILDNVCALSAIARVLHVADTKSSIFHAWFSKFAFVVFPQVTWPWEKIFTLSLSERISNSLTKMENWGEISLKFFHVLFMQQVGRRSLTRVA